MSDALRDLGLHNSIFAAPMAGGASTPELVLATAGEGSIGFLAAGYLTPEALAGQIVAARAADVPFGVNLFAPNPLPIDAAVLDAYARVIQSEADAYGLELSRGRPVEGDDGWSEKIELLLDEPVALVSFTFAIPDRPILKALQRAGSFVVQTVTSVAEARLAVEAGVDALVVQSASAGGHFGTFTPRQPSEPVPLRELIGRIRATVELPLIAAGGLSKSRDIASILGSGADAAMVGTALLRARESGASAVHKSALADPARTQSVVTRAFTGRSARGLRNLFTDRYDELAPFGYPAVHHLTSPLRKAAAAAGDPENVHLWAGTGYRHATAEPVAEILARLAQDL
jgi:nitronate monooxygenase